MRVLIVEDKLDAATPLKKALELTVPNIEVRLSTSLEGGLKEAAIFKPDVVVLDAELPDSGAFETMRRQKEFENAQIVATSAYEEESLVTAAFENGATDFIIKNTGANICQRIIFAHLRKIHASR